MEKKTFKLKLSGTSRTNIPSAEALFRDLKIRDSNVEFLWSHQADIIRAYHKEDAKLKDIALELPTGTGKTLVGLLIAEWRRRTLGERVVYLCPTRQLAHQVGTKAQDYGIKAHVLVGPQKDYNTRHFSDYASANAIAITAYSGLFNTNPKLHNPQTIVLDDAHAGENYIAKMWSISIERSKHKLLYDQIVELYANELPDYLIPDLRDDNATPFQKKGLDLLPGPKFAQKIQALTNLLDAFATRENKLIYPWEFIRGKLNACCAFFSWSEILIRPWVPPILTHSPFADAKQRIYMSATLGAGGELERITGVPKIQRIPVPSGWDRQSTGRRLFIFPDSSFTAEEYNPWISKFIESNERSLILTPHKFVLEDFKIFIKESQIKHKILGSQDIEVSLDAFTNQSNAILALTNRYDGIDLPGDACRALVLFGLPASVNLHEKFLWSRLGLTPVLRDRIRTRITQAVGRCTRSSTDYAVVLMVSGDLFDFCIKRENRSELHPELRAEMDFGLDNSGVDDLDHLTWLVHAFMTQGAEWDDAETDIVKRRDEVTKSTQPYVEALRKVVSLEVEYQYNLWKEDYDAALDKATSIIDQLSGDELASYRALWNYFAGCAAHRLWEMTGQARMQQAAVDRFYRASQSSQAILWFAKLSHELDSQRPTKPSESLLTVLSADLINHYLSNLGTVGGRFEKTIGEYRDMIQVSDADKFDRALTELGKMLGFDAEKPKGQGVPDSVWKLGSNFVLLFECKSDENPSNGISISTCRQANGHQLWQRKRHSYMKNAKMFTVAVSPREFLDSNAAPHAEELLYLHIEGARDLFREAETCLRVIRSKAPDLETEQTLQLIQDELLKAKLTPNEVIARFTKTPMSSLEKR